MSTVMLGSKLAGFSDIFTFLSPWPCSEAVQCSLTSVAVETALYYGDATSGPAPWSLGLYRPLMQVTQKLHNANGKVKINWLVTRYFYIIRIYSLK